MILDLFTLSLSLYCLRGLADELGKWLRYTLEVLGKASSKLRVHIYLFPHADKASSLIQFRIMQDM